MVHILFPNRCAPLIQTGTMVDVESATWARLGQIHVRWGCQKTHDSLTLNMKKMVTEANNLGVRLWSTQFCSQKSYSICMPKPSHLLLEISNTQI